MSEIDAARAEERLSGLARPLRKGLLLSVSTATGSGGTTPSRERARDRRLALYVFLGGSLFLASGLLWDHPMGKSVVGAFVILDGGVPYRDFWTMYAPGHHYLLAGLFALFGREMIVQAAAAVLLRAASGGVFFLILRRIGSTTAVALTLSTVSVGMFWSTGIELRSYPPALLLLLLALDRVIAFFQRW